MVPPFEFLRRCLRWDDVSVPLVSLELFSGVGNGGSEGDGQHVAPGGAETEVVDVKGKAVPEMLDSRHETTINS